MMESETARASDRATARHVFDFDAPPPVAPHALPSLVGGKGAGLTVMAHELGLPVPPGFTITTEACREYLAGSWPSRLDDELHAHVDRLAERVGRRFGDPADPLLVSVRSGAPVSMPGMMDTILNLGLNEATTRGLAVATGDDSFATDCLRRFRAGYLAVVEGDSVPQDPWIQLRSAIEAVFRSWNGERARAYRRREVIPDDLGTAATVQAMVFGNRGGDSGTGVLFTRNPSTGERQLYGDVMFNAQGEDVVAGGHEPEPISVLDERLPEVAAELREYAQRLERHFADLCDVEFTIEDGRLWLLQVRDGKRSPAAALRMAIEMAEDPGFPVSKADAVRRVAHLLADPLRVFVRTQDGPAPITAGLPASPGVATGAIVTSSEAAEAEAASGKAVILVRPETSPEDVRGMARAAGVLTARGGLASHAAVVARGWGIPAVVGATAVQPGDGEVVIDGRTFSAGKEITIDGGSGEVYAGRLHGRWEVAPETATLTAWASELGIELPTSAAEAVATSGPEPIQGATAGEALTAEDVLRALLIKGSVAGEQLAEALLATPEAIEPLVSGLVQHGLAERSGGAIRLSARGRLKADAAIAADRGAIGPDRAVGYVEAFHPLDRRVKEAVTAWQMRGDAINDHTDEAYDARVLDDLSAVHADAAEWLRPLTTAIPRFAAYRVRLERALSRARDDDQRYVASPRVDSFHGVWFELHEELIRLAGRRRAEEGSA